MLSKDRGATKNYLTARKVLSREEQGRYCYKGESTNSVLQEEEQALYCTGRC